MLPRFRLFKLIVFWFYSKDWYKDVLSDAELDALENPPKPVNKGASGSRRKAPKRPQPEDVE